MLRLGVELAYMYGVEYAIAQFRSQLDAVVIDRHLARTLSGNNSPVTTQQTGPHEQAKKNIYIHTNAMAARCDANSPTGVAVPTLATIN
jgi:hypothetical protein